MWTQTPDVMEVSVGLSLRRAGIHLLDLDLYEEPDQAVWRFHLRDQWRPQKKYGDELELNVLELRKAMALGGQPEAIAVWVAFFERWNEEAALERIDDEVLREAILEAHVLERLLVRRFGSLPESVVERLRAADLDALERWTDRILEARTLEEVFAQR